jgi:hypothetical protein
MENAAHVESLDHEVYRAPLTVQPEFEYRKTPQNYRDTYRGPGKLPDQIKVWRVQNAQRGNVVARSHGFMDSPDAEVIAVGFNHGKEYGAIGIGRQGNFLQWGYSDTPSQMTEAGRRLFLNCIHYIHRFEGKDPLIRCRSVDRVRAVLAAGIIDRIDDNQKKDFFLSYFPEELYTKYGSDPNGLMKYYQENIEWVYRDRVFKIDEELKALGLASNRKVETLERLFELTKDQTHAATARRLLDRYIAPQTTYDFKNGRNRIYFTDVGGYKFMVVPEGYLEGKSSEAPPVTGTAAGGKAESGR